MFHQHLEAFLGILGQRCLPGYKKVCVSLFIRTSHAAPQLVNLGQAEPVRPIDQDGVGPRDIKAGFNDCGAYQHVNIPGREPEHDLFQLFFIQTPMDNAQSDLGRQVFQMRCHFVYITYIIVDKIDLAVSAQFFSDGFGDNSVIKFGNIGDNGMTLIRGRGNNADIPYPRQGEMEGPGDRGCCQSQNIHRFPHFFQLFLMPDPEPLLLVKHNKPEVFKRDIFLKEPVGSDDNICFSLFDPADNCALFLGRSESAQTFNHHRIILKTA